jgi:hypothetical protein
MVNDGDGNGRIEGGVAHGQAEGIGTEDWAAAAFGTENSQQIRAQVAAKL